MTGSKWLDASSQHIEVVILLTAQKRKMLVGWAAPHRILR